MRSGRHHGGCHLQALPPLSRNLASQAGEQMGHLAFVKFGAQNGNELVLSQMDGSTVTATWVHVDDALSHDAAAELYQQLGSPSQSDLCRLRMQPLLEPQRGLGANA